MHSQQLIHVNPKNMNEKMSVGLIWTRAGQTVWVIVEFDNGKDMTTHISICHPRGIRYPDAIRILDTIGQAANSAYNISKDEKVCFQSSPDFAWAWDWKELFPDYDLIFDYSKGSWIRKEEQEEQ